MNAPADISGLLKETHRRAIDDANRWRGLCVNLFARGELVIGEALLAKLASKPLPLLLSQRISRLSGLVEKQPKQASALKDFERHIDDRNVIVHGSGKVYVDGQGQWLLTLRALNRSGSIQKHVAQADAEQRVRDLKATVDRLATAFRA